MSYLVIDAIQPLISSVNNPMFTQTGTSSGSSVNFPLPFADADYVIILQPIVNDNSGTYSIQAHSLTTGGFQVNRNINNTATIINGGFTYKWIAAGLKP